MTNEQLTEFWKEYYRKINTYYYAIVFVPLILFAIKYIQLYAIFNKGGEELRAKMLSNPSMLTFWSSLVLMLVIQLLYYKNIKANLAIKELVAKLKQHKKTFLQYTIILQVFAFIIVILLYFIDFPILAVIYGIILAVSSMQRPSYLRIFKIVKLSKDHKKALLGLPNDK